jgi:hypothetical protein
MLMPGYGSGLYGSGPYGLGPYGSPFAVISGQPYFPEAGSISIQSAIGRRSVASFTIKTDDLTYFLEDAQISIYDQNNVRIFAGYLVAPNYNKPGYTLRRYHQLQACDKHRLADKIPVVGSFVGYTGAYIAQWLIDNYLAAEGVTRGHIYDGATIGDNLIIGDTTIIGEAVGTIATIAFDYCKASEAYDGIVKSISSSGVPYYWQINADSTLDLVPYDAIINSTIIDGTQIDEVFNPPSVTRTNPAYRNMQIIKGGTAETVLQNETFIGDSNTQSWPMRFAISQAPAITVDGVAKTVGIRGVDSGKDFYWSKGEFPITQDSGATKLTSSNNGVCNYIGMYNNVTIVTNDAQIALETSIDGSSGIVGEVENIALTSLDAQIQIAGARLTRYAVQSPPEFEFSTLEPGFAPGQLVKVNIADLSLTTNMLIESIQADDQTDGFNIWYRIKCISGPSDTTWVSFWGEITGSGNASNNASAATVTIVTVSKSFAVNISVVIDCTPTTFACPIIGNSTIIGNSLIIC